MDSSLSVLPLHTILAQREAERRSALVEGDRAKLDELLSKDLVHVHTTAAVHNKEQLLVHATEFLQFHNVERGPLLVRQLCDDAAIMTGAMTNTVSRRGHDEQIVVRAFVTQLWVDRGQGWQVASFHATRLPDETTP